MVGVVGILFGETRSQVIASVCQWMSLVLLAIGAFATQINPETTYAILVIGMLLLVVGVGLMFVVDCCGPIAIFALAFAAVVVGIFSLVDLLESAVNSIGGKSA